MGASSLPHRDSRDSGNGGGDEPGLGLGGRLQLLHTDMRTSWLRWEGLEAVIPSGAELTQCPDADPACHSSLGILLPGEMADFKAAGAGGGQRI